MCLFVSSLSGSFLVRIRFQEALRATRARTVHLRHAPNQQKNHENRDKWKTDKDFSHTNQTTNDKKYVS